MVLKDQSTIGSCAQGGIVILRMLSQFGDAPVLLTSEQMSSQVKDVFSGIAPMGKVSRASAWGWLEPGSPALPHVLLQGDEVAVGRSIAETGGDDKAGTSPVPSVFSRTSAVSEGSAAPAG